MTDPAGILCVLLCIFDNIFPSGAFFVYKYRTLHVKHVNNADGCLLFAEAQCAFKKYFNVVGKLCLL